MNRYPTAPEIRAAKTKQLLTWFRLLPAPRNKEQSSAITAIFRRLNFNEVTEEMSREVQRR